MDLDNKAVEMGGAGGFGPILQVKTTGSAGRLNVEWEKKGARF